MDVDFTVGEEPEGRQGVREMTGLCGKTAPKERKEGQKSVI